MSNNSIVMNRFDIGAGEYVEVLPRDYFKACRCTKCGRFTQYLAWCCNPGGIELCAIPRKKKISEI